MEESADSSALALTKRDPNPNALSLYTGALRRAPVRVGLGLVVEYLMFASGVFLALLLFATRVPMRIVDRALGTRLRERFVDLLAKISPG